MLSKMAKACERELSDLEEERMYFARALLRHKAGGKDPEWKAVLELSQISHASEDDLKRNYEENLLKHGLGELGEVIKYRREHPRSAGSSSWEMIARKEDVRVRPRFVVDQSGVATLTWDSAIFLKMKALLFTTLPQLADLAEKSSDEWTELNQICKFADGLTGEECKHGFIAFTAYSLDTETNERAREKALSKFRLGGKNMSDRITLIGIFYNLYGRLIDGVDVDVPGVNGVVHAVRRLAERGILSEEQRTWFLWLQLFVEELFYNEDAENYFNAHYTLLWYVRRCVLLAAKNFNIGRTSRLMNLYQETKIHLIVDEH